ncbi:MAG: SRPBCC family protein [Opitutaceae bacterium]|nr:SRPBCC family protein [Opitutaceae bacterium]
MKPTAPRSRATLLRVALLANAAFSLVTGSGLLFFASGLAPMIGAEVAPVILAVIGGLLLPFGAFTGWLGTRPAPDTLLALLISLADLGWVLGSGLLLVLASGQLTSQGIALVVVIAALVLGFALGQLRGIGTAFAADARDRARFRVCFEFTGGGDPREIWGNLANFGEVARFAPTLASSRLRDGEEPAEGAIRDCADLANRRWSERCTVLNHQTRELSLEFLTREPGFPFPFLEMTGGWSVRTESDRTVVRVWWEGLPKFPLLNPVILPLLAHQAKSQFPVMVRRMGLSGSRSVAGGPALLALAPC